MQLGKLVIYSHVQPDLKKKMYMRQAGRVKQQENIFVKFSIANGVIDSHLLHQKNVPCDIFEDFSTDIILLSIKNKKH